MRMKIFGGIATVTITVIIAFNVSLGSAKRVLPELSLSNIEAQADLWENISDWWNSNVYKCVTQSCSRTYSLFGYYEVTYYGTYSNCVSGDSYAHCWECESSCNAY